VADLGEAVSVVDGEHTRAAGDGRSFERALIEAGHGKAAEDRARLIADGLRVELERALPGGVLDVRAVPWGSADWLVRAELRACEGEGLTDLLTRQFSRLVNPGWPHHEPMADHGQYDGSADPVLMAPGWHAVVPGIDYRPGLKRAMDAASGMGSVLPPVMLAGAMDFEGETWVDGTGVVRLSLTVEDASKLTALVGWAREELIDGDCVHCP